MVPHAGEENKAFFLEIFGSSLGWLSRALINLELAWTRARLGYRGGLMKNPVRRQVRRLMVDATPTFVISL
jgi:hypothetical protein